MTLTFVPFGNRVVIEVDDAEKKTASGLLIPDVAQEKPQEGTVVAVGPGERQGAHEYLAIPVEVGDRVLYSKYGGTPYKEDGVEYLVVLAQDVLGRL